MSTILSTTISKLLRQDSMTADEQAEVRGQIGAADRYVANVMDYGAVGDGFTDDTAAIISAIDAVKTSGGVVYLPAGTYAIDDDGAQKFLTLYSNMTLTGDGIGQTTIKPLDSAGIGSILYMSAVENVTLRDFTLDGNTSRFDAYAWINKGTEGVDTKTDSVGITIERVRFQNMHNEAVDFDWINYDSEDYTIIIRDCVFENIRGEAIHNLNWGIVDSCKFINCGNKRLQSYLAGEAGAVAQSAIDIQGEKVAVRNCHFRFCARALLTYASVSGNLLGRATAQISMSGNPSNGETVTIGGVDYTFKTTWAAANDVEIGTDANETALTLAQTINGDQDGTDADANVRATYATPSLASGTPAMVLLIARTPGTPGNSVTLAESATNVTVSAAALSGGGTAGETGVRISNCIIEDCTAYAIENLATNTVIEGCRIIGTTQAINGGTGAKIRNCEIILRNNYITDIGIAVGAYSVIDGCNLSGARIRVNFTGTVISNNYIVSAYGPIYIQGGIPNVRICGNTLVTTGTRADGVAAAASPIVTNSSGATGMIVTGNTILGGAYGVTLQTNSVVTGNYITGSTWNSVYSASGTGNIICNNYIDKAVNAVGANNIIEHNSI